LIVHPLYHVHPNLHVQQMRGAFHAGTDNKSAQEPGLQKPA
jgi:hypothetical protein